MIEMTVGAFKRRISIVGGYDFRHVAGNFGVHGNELLFDLVDSKGAVTWRLMTGWMVQSARQFLAELKPNLPPDHTLDREHKPATAGLSTHSPVPLYEGDQSGQCDLLPGGICYGDVGFLLADELLEGFLHGGDAWLWPHLEAYHGHVFQGGPMPDWTPIPRRHSSEQDMRA